MKVASQYIPWGYHPPDDCYVLLGTSYEEVNKSNERSSYAMRDEFVARLYKELQEAEHARIADIHHFGTSEEAREADEEKNKPDAFLARLKIAYEFVKDQPARDLYRAWTLEQQNSKIRNMGAAQPATPQSDFRPLIPAVKAKSEITDVKPIVLPTMLTDDELLEAIRAAEHFPSILATLYYHPDSREGVIETVLRRLTAEEPRFEDNHGQYVRAVEIVLADTPELIKFDSAIVVALKNGLLPAEDPRRALNTELLEKMYVKHPDLKEAVKRALGIADNVVIAHPHASHRSLEYLISHATGVNMFYAGTEIRTLGFKPRASRPSRVPAPTVAPNFELNN